MATRGTIAVENEDGSVSQIYSHWDNYLSCNGKILFEHYQDLDKVRELISIGDVSSLNDEIGVQHDFDSRDSAFDNMCRFYGRDRGETGVDARVFESIAAYEKNHQYEEYEYIFKKVDGKHVWFVSSYGSKYIPLAEALQNEAEEVE